MNIFCLKNTRTHKGESIVYDTKPWNAQDVYCPMGTYNRELDMVYLGRNVHLDGVGTKEWPDAAEPLRDVIRACWARNESAIINRHRKNYVALDPARAEAGCRILAELLGGLAQAEDVCFLSTAEVGRLYRDGYSVRRVGTVRLVRQWSEPTMPVRLDGPVSRIVSLPDTSEQSFTRDGDDVMADLAEGNYWVE